MCSAVVIFLLFFKKIIIILFFYIFLPSVLLGVSSRCLDPTCPRAPCCSLLLELPQPCLESLAQPRGATRQDPDVAAPTQARGCSLTALQGPSRGNLPQTTARSPLPGERLWDFWRLGVIVSKPGGGDFSKATEQLPLQKKRWSLAGKMAGLFLVG